MSEPFELPHGATWGYLIANGILALAFNLFFMTSIAITSPLMASVGGMLAIPISGIVDYITHGDTFGAVAIVGSMFIITGFACLTYAEFRHMKPSAINAADTDTHNNNNTDGSATYGSLSSSPVHGDHNDSSNATVATPH